MISLAEIDVPMLLTEVDTEPLKDSSPDRFKARDENLLVAVPATLLSWAPSAVNVKDETVSVRDPTKISFAVMRLAIEDTELVTEPVKVSLPELMGSKDQNRVLEPFMVSMPVSLVVRLLTEVDRAPKNRSWEETEDVREETEVVVDPRNISFTVASGSNERKTVLDPVKTSSPADVKVIDDTLLDAVAMNRSAAETESVMEDTVVVADPRKTSLAATMGSNDQKIALLPIMDSWPDSAVARLLNVLDPVARNLSWAERLVVRDETVSVADPLKISLAVTEEARDETVLDAEPLKISIPEAVRTKEDTVTVPVPVTPVVTVPERFVANDENVSVVVPMNFSSAEIDVAREEKASVAVPMNFSEAERDDAKDETALDAVPMNFSEPERDDAKDEAALDAVPVNFS
jgi:hypothetical protein